MIKFLPIDFLSVSLRIPWKNKNALYRLQICSQGNSLFSSSHALNLKMLVIFSSKDIKQGHNLELVHLNAW